MLRPAAAALLPASRNWIVPHVQWPLHDIRTLVAELCHQRALKGVQEDEAFVRIKLVSCETLKSKVLSLKQDLKYWPTWCAPALLHPPRTRMLCSVCTPWL